MTFTYTQTCQTPFGSLQDAGKVFTGAAMIVVDESLISEADNEDVDAVFGQAGFKCMAILADQPALNISDMADTAFADVLVANQMKFHTTVATDVGGIHYSTLAQTVGTLKIRVLYDPTP